jgi:hypothetical protein
MRPRAVSGPSRGFFYMMQYGLDAGNDSRPTVIGAAGFQKWVNCQW